MHITLITTLPNLPPSPPGKFPTMVSGTVGLNFKPDLYFLDELPSDAEHVAQGFSRVKRLTGPACKLILEKHLEDYLDEDSGAWHDGTKPQKAMLVVMDNDSKHISHANRRVWDFRKSKLRRIKCKFQKANGEPDVFFQRYFLSWHAPYRSLGCYCSQAIL